MITYRLGIYHQNEKAARELTDAIKRQKGSCDTLWLITDHHFPTIERHREYAEGWLGAVKIFKEAGLEVSIQTAQTFGHGDPSKPLAHDRMAGMTDESGNLRDLMVGPDGRENIACFCWNGEYYIDYMKKMLATYAEVIKPHRFWLDDDVRATNHAPNRYGCFCDRCISKFNKLHGSDFDRAGLVNAINSDPVWRERLVEYNRSTLYNFVYEVTKAILEVSPDTAMGYEFGHFSSYTGRDYDFVFDAFRDAGAKHIHARPGAGHYNDKDPYGEFVKAFDLARENALTPSFVESRDAELENLPGVLYGKSIGGIINESALDLAVGCTGLTLTDIQSLHEPIEYYERILSALSEARPYFERLSEVSRVGNRAGVCIYREKKPYNIPKGQNCAPFEWAERCCFEKHIPFTRLGIPYTFEDEGASCYALRSTVVDAMSDGEIEELLRRPVITDGDAVRKIVERGFGSYFGIKLLPTGERAFERFTDDEINGKYSGIFFDENPYASTPMPHYLIENLSESDRVLGVLQKSPIFDDGSDVGACSVITEIKGKGVRWAIFGYSLWGDLVSGAKRNQILGAIDEISPLRAKLLTEDVVALYSSVDRAGKLLSATLASASQGGSIALELAVREPAGENAEIMGAKKSPRKLECEKNEKGELLLKIPPLSPYEVVTIFFS